MAADRAPAVEGDGIVGSVSRLRGRAFERVAGAATVFGITVVAGLLLYVASDAIRPFTADPRWLATFAATLGLPVGGLSAFFLARDRAAGKVAYDSVGVLAVGLILAGGLVVLFRELITPAEWFALVAALGVAALAIALHARERPEAALERLFVTILAPVLTVFGVPGVGVEYTVTTPLTDTALFTVAFELPGLLPSVRELVLSAPVLPVGWLLLVGTLTLPAAAAVGRVVASRRDDGRGLAQVVLGAGGTTVVAAVLAPFAGYAPADAVLVVTALALPAVVYLEGVLRRRRGLLGLLLPVAVVGGLLAGVALTRALGVAGPESWLDWGFLTEAPSRTPADAGIYPQIVGSVMIVLVIALAAFPVGVGAAIYLEEYAPSTGRLGRLVSFVEVNVGNLAGVPSIVYGLLGLALFVQGVGLPSGIVIVGGLTVGLLVLPIVIISAQEALRAVPDSRRRASYGMGATRWQTVRDVVLPEALPGILTGTILALGRAIGETAPLLMIGVAASVRAPPDGFFSKTGAMPRQIFTWSSEIQPEFRFGVLAAGVLVLLVVLLIVNGTAIVLRNRYQGST